MFVVYVGSILTTYLFIQALGGKGEAPAGFILAITLWLWFTVLFANFAEAVAEGRSKAQAAALRAAKRDVAAKKLEGGAPRCGVRLDAFDRSAQGRPVPGRSRGSHSGRRTGHRGRRLGGRKRHHRRVRARDPRVGRRFLLRHRRHPGAVRLARRARHGQSRRGVPRPHDQHGRERAAPEDAERDRA